MWTSNPVNIILGVHWGTRFHRRIHLHFMGYKPAVVDDIVGRMTYGLRMISEHKFIQTLSEMRMGRYSVTTFVRMFGQPMTESCQPHSCTRTSTRKSSKQLGDLLKHEYPPRKGKLLGQRANFLHIREIGTNFQTVSVLSNQVRSYFSGGGNPR